MSSELERSRMGGNWRSHRTSRSTQAPGVALKALALVGISLAAFMVVAHAGLVPIGLWQPDEYVQLSEFRDKGFSSASLDLLLWTPRPVHVLLLGLYAEAVECAGVPLVASALALAWTAAFATIFAAMRVASKRPLACTLAVFASFLLVGRPGEIFYWPTGLSAYLPTVVGITGASLLLAQNKHEGCRAWGVAICLAIASAASEMGAAFVLVYASLRALTAWLGLGSRLSLSSLAWLLPGLLALVELGVFSSHRAGMSAEAMESEASTLGAIGPSLVAGTVTLLWEMLTFPMLPGTTLDLVLGLPLKLGLFLGLRRSDRSISAGQRREAWVRVIALHASCLFSLVFAYSQFGLACCMRHETTRQIMIVLAIASIASVYPARQSSWLTTSRARTVLVLLPLIVLAARRSGELWHDYSVYGEALEARESTWSSGRDSTSSSMRYTNGPGTKVVNHWRLLPGTYRLDDPPREPLRVDWHFRAVLRFFGKDEVEVDEPEEGGGRG